MLQAICVTGLVMTQVFMYNIENVLPLMKVMTDIQGALLHRCKKRDYF